MTNTTQTTNEIDVVDLAIRLRSLEERKSETQASIDAIKEQIIGLAGFQKPEGQESMEFESGRGSVRVEFKQPVSTKVDSDLWDLLREGLPAGHPAQSLFRQRYELDLRAARKVQDTQPDAWRDVADVVTRKPGKVSVKVTDVVFNADGGAL